MTTGRKYAAETTVPVERSEAEIRKLLIRYGAERFGSVQQPSAATIMFELHDRRVRMTLPLPQPSEFAQNQAGHAMGKTQQEQAWQKATRQRWRALVLVLKAKLEAVESGVETFEQAFLAHIALPSGETYGEWAIPQIAIAYETEEMPPMLPGLPTAARVIAIGEGKRA